MKKSRFQHPVVRQFNFLWQAIIVYVLFAFFFILPLPAASAVGGWIGRTFGPLFGISKRALKHIRLAFPEKSDAERRAILVDMWDNLGRVAAESAHLRRFKNSDRITFEGLNYIQQAKNDNRAAMLVSGHYANWEISPIAAWDRGFPLATVYRRPNNPYVDVLIRWARKPVTPELLTKGKEGARGLLRWLKSGNSVGLLVDQKMSDGIAVKFFGHDAMTGQVPLQIALMTNSAVLPAQVIRTKGCHFRVVVHPEIKPDPALSGEAQVRDLTTRMNMFLEDHIRQYPGQWLWLHRRWGNI